MNDTAIATTFPYVTYKHKTDTKPQPHQSTFEQLKTLFSSHDIRPEKDGPLFSPTIYKHGATRANANVQQLTMLVLDFDDGTAPNDHVARWEAEGRAFFIYSTYRHTAAHPKWRAVFPFYSPVDGKIWPRLWRPLTHLIAGSIVDEQCKDPSRAYYLPCCAHHTSNDAFFYGSDGEFLDTSTVELEPEVEAAPVAFTPVLVPSNADYARKYALSALNGEVQKMANATNGTRHKQRRNSAIALGGFVPLGVLSEDEIYESLSINFGDDEKGARDTIRDGIAMGIAKPRPIPEPTHIKRPMLRGGQARAVIRGASEREAETVPSDSKDNEEAENEAKQGQYGVIAGRTHLIIEKTDKGGITTVTTPSVWDGAAHIVEEIMSEEGQSIYRIEGRTRSGRTFELEVEATRFADSKQLLGLLSNVAGANCVFSAGMEKYLGPSIKSFTDDSSLLYGRRFNRVGWYEGTHGREFLIPGREAERTAIQLERKLPYRIDPAADLQSGLQVLEDVLNAQKLEATVIATTFAFQAPLAELAHWRDERYVMFIAGRTGSFKSAWAMAMMPLWGVGFSSEDQVLKMGEGGTNNSRMDFLVRANDAVLLFDNYKPNTGKGAPELINLINMSLEGGEKDRLNRNQTQRVTRVCHAWPMFTGEDFPDHDAASTARSMVVWFPYTGKGNAELTRAQRGARHLSAVMGAWLDWLQSEDAGDIIRNIASLLTDRRTYWADFLRKQRDDMANINRVATNLATNELTWRIMGMCPALEVLCKRYDRHHSNGLEAVAKDMANRSAESSEANRYLEALRSLLASKRLLLMPKTFDIPDDTKSKYLGWEDKDGVYVIPEIAHKEVNELLRDGSGANSLTKNAIHKQLVQIEALADVGKDGPVRVIRCGSRVHRLLHMKPELFDLTED